MLNLKFKSCLLLLVVVFGASPGAFAIFDARIGTVGMAIPFCSVESRSNANYRPQACSGYRIDYITRSNIVIALEGFTVRFNDPFLKKYNQIAGLVGYRFDFGDLIKLFFDRQIPVLSSLHVALVPLVGDLESGLLDRTETLTTADYRLLLRGGPSKRIEVGWRLNESWDVFFYDYSVSVGPFKVRKKDRINTDRLTIRALYLGLHYTY